ncbi:hypothetical protein [Xanthobacter sp. 91]|nr:hypothetical protein [Xanthobacter sp. 91]
MTLGWSGRRLGGLARQISIVIIGIIVVAMTGLMWIGAQIQIMKPHP